MRGPLHLTGPNVVSSPSGGLQSNPIVQGISRDPSPNLVIFNMAIPCELEITQGKPNIFETMGLKRSTNKKSYKGVQSPKKKAKVGEGRTIHGRTRTVVCNWEGNPCKGGPARCPGDRRKQYLGLPWRYCWGWKSRAQGANGREITLGWWRLASNSCKIDMMYSYGTTIV